METFIKQLQQEIGLDIHAQHIEELTKLLRYFADEFPFENIDVLLKNKEAITPELLKDKLLFRKRGGLCYELNAFLYLVLKELNYDVFLSDGTVYSETGWATDRTHVLNIVTLNARKYVLDTGFGSQLSRQPLEINGEAVQSAAGTLRVTKRKTEKGTYALEKLESGHWILRYAFDLHPIEWEGLNRIKQVITDSPSSAFNRRLIISKCLRDQTMSVNNDRLRVYKSKQKDEKTIRFTNDQELLTNIREFVSAPLYEQVERYLSAKKSRK